MSVLNIKVGTTTASIKTGIYDGIQYHINNFCKRKAIDWTYAQDKQKFVPDKAYAYHDHKTNTWHIPVNYVPILEQYLKEQHLNVEIKTIPIKPCEARDIDIKLKDEFNIRENQEKGIEFLIDSSIHRKGLSLQTGMGKTFSAITAATHFNKAIIVIVSGLMEQWMESFIKFTNITRDDIYVFKLTSSIIRLLKSDYKPKVIIASLETVREYIKAEKRNEVPLSFENILIKYGIGTKIMDEVHLRFHAMTQIDLRCNPIAQHFYLTATFKSNNKSTNHIFRIIYPDEFMYEKQREHKHINVTFYAYNIDMNPRITRTKYGYNHSRFEKHLLKRKTKLLDFLNRILYPLFDIHYMNIKNENEKCVIYFATTKMINIVLQYLRQRYKSLKIDSYIGKDSITKFNENDVLLTTYKKCGEAKDIPFLRTVINTISTKAETRIIQVAGRIRPLENNDGEYADMFNTCIPEHKDYYLERSRVLKSLCKSYNEEFIY